MYKGKSLAAVVPAYNEATQIGAVIATMPDYVDFIVIVDDCSRDRTREIVLEFAAKDPRVILVPHTVNQGVGGAIATGYKWARDKKMDLATVLAGDGQMDPADLPRLLEPVVTDRCDYTKGNKLLFPNAWNDVPTVRFLGNVALTFLTKIASGYWHVTDSQHGYTVCNGRVLRRIDWDRMYKRYGMPNDLLVRLNIEDFRVQDVPVAPRYNIGEQSKLQPTRVAPRIAKLLTRLFLWRMKEKYIIRNFHPLVLFYLLATICLTGALILSFRVGTAAIVADHVPPLSFLTLLFLLATAFQSAAFAMWFDMQMNSPLKGTIAYEDD